MERYFIFNYSQLTDVEMMIKNKKIKSNVIDLIVRQSSDQRYLTWFLLERDISFERKPMGSGIIRFTIDLTMPFFLKAKSKQEKNPVSKQKKE